MNQFLVVSYAFDSYIRITDEGYGPIYSKSLSTKVTS
jgi:hypothetical protein